MTSLYFGGGTPALLAEDLAEIIAALRSYFTITQGIGIELHPQDITKELLHTVKAAGVTMVSVGVQSFDKGCLAKLGRKSPDLAHRFALLRQANFDVIDCDLIFAIPGQTARSLAKDMETAFALGATQISTYPFIDFTFADNAYKPLPARAKKRLLSTIVAYAQARGLQRTSVWTFAKKNTGQYSSITRDNFLGFGVSATTLLQDQFKINTFSVDGYVQRLQQGRLPTAVTLHFTPRQRACYYLFWSSYGMEIDPAAFQKLLGRPLQSLYGLEMALAQALGFVKKTGAKYRLTPEGAYHYHYLEQVYTHAYIDKMWNISRTTPFPSEIVLR